MHHDPPSDYVAHTSIVPTKFTGVEINNAGRASCPRRNLKKLL